MDYTKMKRKELLKLREDIDSQIKKIDSIKKWKKSSKEKTKLSDLKGNDKIFCINFNGFKIYHMDFIKIKFNKQDDSNEWTNFTTLHDTSPMGCSSSLRDECMNKHYFLNEFCSCMYFFTLKPENWKVDLKSELDRLIKHKENIFDKKILIFKNKINSLIENKNEVEMLITSNDSL